MRKTFPKYEHRGFTYDPYEDIETDDMGRPENSKLFHYVNTPEGRQVSFDWSPYEIPSFDTFKLWIELGLPDRFTVREFGGPLDAKDLNDILNGVRR